MIQKFTTAPIFLNKWDGFGVRSGPPDVRPRGIRIGLLFVLLCKKSVGGSIFCIVK